MSVTSHAEPSMPHNAIAAPGSALADSAAAFLAARDLHVADDLENAEKHYRRAIALDAANADAIHLLGVIHAQQGRHAEAEKFIRRALHLKEVWAYYDNLGNSLQEQGKVVEAISAYARAVELKPDRVDTLNKAIFLAVNLDDLEQTASLLHHLLSVHPENSIVNNNLGNTLYRLNHYAAAEACYQQAIKANPANASAYYNLGVLLHVLHRQDEAIAAYQKAIQLEPNSPIALNNLGFIFQRQKRYAEAEAAFKKAMSVHPENIDVVTSLGNLYSEQKRFAEATTQLLAAVAMAPECDSDRVLLSYCKRQHYDWDGLETIHAHIQNTLASGTTEPLEPFQVFSIAGISAAEQFLAGKNKINKEYAETLTQPSLIKPETDWQHQPLRIGYLSADFSEHPVMHLLLGVLENRDTTRFATYLYSIGPPSTDCCRQRAHHACEQFHDLRDMADRAAAAKIAADEIDILVDLMGFTANSRLGITAWRPAPVIVSWLGYPGTLGDPRLADYLIGDPIVSPLEHAHHFSETLALMPHTYQPTDNRRPIGKKPARAEAGLPEQGLVFCSFNQAFKLNPETFAVWCQLLHEVPGSVLWLAELVASGIINLRSAALRHGIDPKRILFAKRTTTLEDHLGRLQLADIALDTFPYGSHTTGSDALWAGVPLVSRCGETFASRVSASLLAAIGLPQLVANSWDEYLAIAKRIATDPQELKALRTHLQAHKNTCPLFDTPRFSRDLERLYQQIWQQHQTGVRSAFALPPA